MSTALRLLSVLPILILSVWVPGGLSAQIDMEMRTERSESGFNVVIDNREFIPVTVDVRLKMNNLVSSRGADFTVVVPPDTSGFIAATLRVENDRRGIGLDAGVTTTYGDRTIVDLRPGPPLRITLCAREPVPGGTGLQRSLQPRRRESPRPRPAGGNAGARGQGWG